MMHWSSIVTLLHMHLHSSIRPSLLDRLSDHEPTIPGVRLYAHRGPGQVWGDCYGNTDEEDQERTVLVRLEDKAEVSRAGDEGSGQTGRHEGEEV